MVLAQTLYFNLNLLRFKIINMKNFIKYSLGSFILCVALTSCTQEKDIIPMAVVEPIVEKNWQFESVPSWQDEFSTGTTPDATKWGYDVGGGGWGNNELQYYTSGTNSTIAGGKLIITAKKENFSGREYTSSRMITKGKADWLYGRVEVKAKLPKGRGTWPAIWMFPTDLSYGNWPTSGEIDIMEHVGYDQNKVHFTIHNATYNFMRGNQKTAIKTIPTASDSFHVYRVDWTPYAIRGFIDGERYFEYTNSNTGFTTWPYDKKFFLILNIAVGGNWGGVQGVDNNIFPATMEIDYVKYFKIIL